MSDIITHLTFDHQHIRTELRTIIADWKDDAPGQEPRFAGIARELRMHADFEEDEVYPLLEENPADISAVESAYDDHELINDLVEDIEALDPAAGAWLTTVRELLAALDRHIAAEEADLLPRLAALQDAEELEDLGRRYEERSVRAERF